MPDWAAIGKWLLSLPGLLKGLVQTAVVTLAYLWGKINGRGEVEADNFEATMEAIARQTGRDRELRADPERVRRKLGKPVGTRTKK